MFSALARHKLSEMDSIFQNSLDCHALTSHLLDSIGSGLIVIDVDQKVVTLNERARETELLLAGRRPREIVHLLRHSATMAKAFPRGPFSLSRTSPSPEQTSSNGLRANTAAVWARWQPGSATRSTRSGRGGSESNVRDLPAGLLFSGQRPGA